MIRITFLLRRKEGMELGEFQTYWREQHGPLVASLADNMNCLRYVQVHTLPGTMGQGNPRGEMEPPYDGVAELWFESVESMLEAPGVGSTLLDDERKFIDLPTSPTWLAYEYPQVNPTPEDIIATEESSIVKFYYPLRHLKNLSEADAQLYWRTNHGPIIRRQATASGVKRYIQVHRFDSEIEAHMRAERGTTVDAYTGHAELWFDTAASVSDPVAARQANARAVADESKFIDFSRSSMWHGKEHVVVDKMAYETSS